MFNMNAKQMEKMMKQMGIQQEQIDAEEVIIKTGGGEIVVSNPQVVKVKMGGQETFQITGEILEREKAESAEQKEKSSDEDAKLVAQQSGASIEDARAALAETGDIAEAIMRLKK